MQKSVSAYPVGHGQGHSELTNAWNFCLIIELLIIGILNYWAIIGATRGKRAAPTTIIESSIIPGIKHSGEVWNILEHSEKLKHSGALWRPFKHSGALWSFLKYSGAY